MTTLAIAVLACFGLPVSALWALAHRMKDSSLGGLPTEAATSMDAGVRPSETAT